MTVKSDCVHEQVTKADCECPYYTVTKKKQSDNLGGDSYERKN